MLFADECAKSKKKIERERENDAEQWLSYSRDNGQDVVARAGRVGSVGSRKGG